MVVRATPTRTCIGCKARVTKSDLIRLVVIVADAAQCVAPDPQGLLPGRGAYLHPNLSCLEMAERRRVFPRAFRRQGPLDSHDVHVYVETAARSGV